jgi:hypothetical protein
VIPARYDAAVARPLHILTMLSLAICTAGIALQMGIGYGWVVAYTSASRTCYSATLGAGAVRLMRTNDSRDGEPGWEAFRAGPSQGGFYWRSYVFNWDQPPHDFLEFKWGTLTYAHRRLPATTVSRVVIIPSWFVYGAAAVLPLSWIVRRRLPRRSDGRCHACGYDLRATPDRCPECGTVSAGAIGTRRRGEDEG